MKKIFIVAGEVSGDKVAAWYLEKLKKNNPQIQCHAVGGSCLQKTGAQLYDRIENLNVVGVVEVIKKLKFILRFLRGLSFYILDNSFNEVVLVDFPGFNLRLAKRLKKSNPNLKIIYLCPPQLWAWGQWRIKKLKKFCDKLIVLYPFEVEWYKKHEIEVEFLGNPSYSKIEFFLKNEYGDSNFLFQRRNQIAIVPASRESEIEKLLPFFVDIAKRFKRAYPKVKIVLPLAESFDISVVEKKLKKLGIGRWGKDIEIITGEEEKLKALSKCYLAITKPGTITLELALLRVPSVVLYKASWLTYLLARSFVKIEYMSLPNLLLNKLIYPEFIQLRCKSEKIFKQANELYKDFIFKKDYYQKQQNDFDQLKSVFKIQE